MKKFLILILTLSLLLTSMTVFADIEEKLEGHWSKGMIDKYFVALYFPNLAKNNFEKLNPGETMNNKDFSLSFGSLAKEYEIGTISNNIISNKRLTRKEVVKTVGNKLKYVEDLRRGNEKLPFKDMDTMDDESIEALDLLYNLKIIAGVSKDKFAPDNNITQAEAILILQRVKLALDIMDEIPFTTKGIVQSYNNQEAMIVRQNGDKVLVTITKEFPTPGYGISVEKIVRDSENRNEIFLDITPPDSNMNQIQVITYKTITVEIDESELKGEKPYVFIVDEIKSNLF